MKIVPENYERMRNWMARLVLEVFPDATPEHDPIAVLDRFAAKSPSIARKSLAIGIGDILEMTDGWPGERVRTLDDKLNAENLPTLSEVRVTFSNDIKRIIQRGHIRNEAEYDAVRNVADFPGVEQERLRALLDTYENQT